MRLRGNEKETQTPSRRRQSEDSDNDFDMAIKQPPNDHFAALASFHRTQLSEINQNESILEHRNKDASRQLSRLLSTRGVSSLRKQSSQLSVMREAIDRNEGLYLDTLENEDERIIHRMKTLGWCGATTSSQRDAQTGTSSARFFSDLYPVATPVRSRRTKRCRKCRHQLVRPVDSRSSAKFKIRLVALSYIPRITLRPLDPTPNSSQLTPLKSTYFILTLHNPLFDSVTISLATPRVTPGRVESRVTLLCPQFDIGANAEMWDDALDLTGQASKVSAKQGQQAEAGKVWEKGRNWTSVVMEVVPGSLAQTDLFGKIQSVVSDSDAVLEIPMFVRMEYDTEDTSHGSDDDEPIAVDTRNHKAGVKKVHRELAFWCVVGVGCVGV